MRRCCTATLFCVLVRITLLEESGGIKLEKQEKKLRIAMLGHKRIPSREGGIEVVVEELATRMVDLGHEVTVFNRKGKHVANKTLDTNNIVKEYKGIKIRTVPTIDYKGLSALSSSIFASIFATLGKFDVIHFHAEGPCAMLWLPHLFGKRTVATIHGLDWQREKWKNGFASKYIKFGELVATKYADEIIVLSKNVQNYFLETYQRETKYIPNGVNKPTIKAADEITKKFNLHRDEYILYLGRIVPEKGLRYLINAFKNVDTDKKLVIAGGASDTDEFLKEVKDLAKDDTRIIFTGFVQGQILQELYSNAYIYTLPSDLEGMPLSLLEAMSYGNCCLVSDISECQEVVEDKAVLFRKSSQSDIEEKLLDLLKQPELVTSYKSISRNHVEMKYNWYFVTQNTLSTYRK